jgi:hypothetical protein
MPELVLLDGAKAAAFVQVYAVFVAETKADIKVSDGCLTICGINVTQVLFKLGIIA